MAKSSSARVPLPKPPPSGRRERDDTPIGRVVSILGGPRVVRRPVRTSLDLVDAVRDGLDWSAFDATARAVDGSTEEVATGLGLAKRTLDRRRTLGRLEPAESERVVRLARIAARATEVLGDAGAMQRWIREPNRALGGRTPLGLLDTEIGAQAVLDVLGRIEHGVFG